MAARGYERSGEQSIMTLDYAAGFPEAPLPEGFRLVALATDPAYRRLGLARAALVEGMRKTAARGVRYCIGGDQAFYRDLGFKRACALEYWRRSW